METDRLYMVRCFFLFFTCPRRKYRSAKKTSLKIILFVSFVCVISHLFFIDYSDFGSEHLFFYKMKEIRWLIWGYDVVIEWMDAGSFADRLLRPPSPANSNSNSLQKSAPRMMPKMSRINKRFLLRPIGTTLVTFAAPKTAHSSWYSCWVSCSERTCSGKGPSSVRELTTWKWENTNLGLAHLHPSLQNKEPTLSSSSLIWS